MHGGLMVVAAYSAQQSSNDAAHPFTQESNFWYLCGIDEPDWLVIIDGSQQKSWLVMPDISEAHRIFDGGMSAAEAKKISGVDVILTADEGASLLRELAKKHPLVHTIGQPPHAESFNFVLNPSIAKNNQLLERYFKSIRRKA